MSTFFITLFAFVFAIGILVVFHEFGHFWVARRLGVKVLRFSLGFGKPLWRWRDKHQTEFVVSALPLGGYVKMLDEREGEVLEDEKQFAFNRKPLWVRFAIVLAGPIFNFIFAIFAYWLMYMIGIVGAIPLIGEITPSSIAAKAGLVEGEEITRIDGENTPTWQQINKVLMNRLGDKGTLSVEAKKPDGSMNAYTLDLDSWELKGNKPDLIHSIGITPYQPPIKPEISEVIAGEPAAQVGILPQDIIVAVNDQPIQNWQQFTHIVAQNPHHALKLSIRRQQVLKEFTLSPRIKESDTGETVGFVGLIVKTGKMPDNLIRKERLGPVAALMAATEKTYEFTLITVKLIGKMLVGDIGLHALSGPLTVAQGAGATVVFGIQYYLGFLALISVSLGVLNLLPIPVLDGGHLLYFFLEMILGRPVPERIQVYGFKLGMMFLFFLMCIAFYNDLSRLF